jgi:hypothetical protein
MEVQGRARRLIRGKKGQVAVLDLEDSSGLRQCRAFLDEQCVSDIFQVH